MIRLKMPGVCLFTAGEYTIGLGFVFGWMKSWTAHKAPRNYGMIVLIYWQHNLSVVFPHTKAQSVC